METLEQEAKKDNISLLELMRQMESMGVIEDNPLRHINYEKYLNEKAREKGIPYAGIFELTPRCNLDCKMCYVHLTPKQMNRDEISAET